MDEREYLMDVDNIPEIPDFIDEKFREVLSAYKSYMNRANVDKEELQRGVDLIERAYYFAFKAHRNQKRKNGEMYIVHPIATAEILAELEVDAESLAAALLHDTIEDTEADTEMITELFGNTMAILVEGVTKLNQISSISKEEGQKENISKMLIAMTKDIRVILIKLADRLHNMRTMQYQTPQKQVEKARETLDIYVPFAERFGVFKIKGELEDLCLRYLDHDGYYELVGLISAKRSEREAFIAQVVGEIREKIDSFGIKDFDIEGRPKRFYSIWKKMHNKDRDISQIYDMYACRIIVNSVAECYMVLGIVHEMYIPLPGRFKDYIGNPKENGYQSLHTTVKRPGGKTFGETTFEVQIRTYSMHREAEFGIASHWHYKESGGSTAFDEDVYDKRVDWVRQFLEAQKDAEDPQDFLELFKTNVAPGEVFVFTPKGKILRLPEGSCPIDFAYSIHSGIGNHMHGAKVNNRIVPLSYELKNGDVVEILSSEKIKGPSKDWIKMVKTASARSKINSWFKKEARAENIVEGKEKLEREIERSGFTPSQLITPEILKVVLPKYSYNSMDDMYAAVGYGSVAVGKLFGRLRDEYIKTLSEDERLELGYRTTSDGQVVYYSPADLPEELGKGDQIKTPKKTAVKKPEKAPEKNRLENDIVIEGMDNFAVHLAKCCHPAPGDRIIGYITQNGGVGVHREGCTNIVNILKYKDRSIKDRQRAERIVQAQWGSGKTNGIYDVKIGITATDRNYLLIDILSMLKEENINVEKIDTHISADFIAEINMTITVKSLEQYDRVIGRIKSVKDIIDVVRL